MKKTVFIILLVICILLPGTVFAAGDSLDQDAQKTVKEYFDLRYKMLSNLNYEDSIKSYLNEVYLISEKSMSEADVLETIIQYRKAQINDLRFSKYSYGLAFNDIQAEGDKVWVTVSETVDYYFKCAPTVKNHAVIEHYMVLQKGKDKWTILKDDYLDTDGVKKLLNQYYLEASATLEDAKKKVLSEAQNQAAARITKLQKMMEGLKSENIMVLFINKPVAYANGWAGKIEDNVSPMVIEGRTFLPLRFTGEKLGAEITWDKQLQVAELKGNHFEIKVKIGEKSITVNNEKRPLDVPAKVVNGRILLPVRAVADAVGKQVFWDQRGLIILSDAKLDKEQNSGLINKLVEYYEVLFTKSDFPRIDGSTATYPLSMEIGKELLGLSEIGVKGFITHNTTHNAYVNLVDRKADIIFVTQPSPEELQLAAKKGIQLEAIPICKEGFVFLANKKNTVNNLTSKQVKDIYQGKIKNWKEVGGEDYDIIPYQREKNAGSQTIMENTVMKGIPMMDPPKEVIVVGMGELIDRVADFSNAKNALGYSVYYFASTMYQNRDVKMLSIDGVEPNKQTIREDKYPFIASYYAVLRKDEPQKSNARKLLAWLLGEEGQTIVDQSGFVPVK